MLRLSFAVDVSGMARRFHALVDSVDDLSEPLLRTGGYLRARTKRDVFDVEGPGWKALDPETAKRKLNDSHVALLSDTGRGRTGKDRSQVQRVVREADALIKQQAREAKLRQRLATAREKGRKTETIHRNIAGSLKRQADAIRYIRLLRFRAVAAGIPDLVGFARHEMARAKRHGVMLRQYKRLARAQRAVGMEMSDSDRRTMLRKGARRYRASEASTHILGGLRDTLALRLVNGNRAVEVFSKAFISGVHNAGGTAGHGAKIPARPFMFIRDSDLAFLVERLKEKQLAAWVEAA